MSNILDKYEEEAKLQTDPQRQKAIKSLDDTSNAKIEQTKDIYDKATQKAKAAYEGEYQRNAVNRMVNERVIAERNANLGLTDSGLNRTQQTANQFSYANQKGNIDLTRQNAISTLEENLAAAIAKIKQENEAGKLSINQQYDQYNTQLANQMYNADIAQSQLAQQQAIAASQAQAEINRKNERNYAGIDQESQKAMYYDGDGKLYLYEKGINPYTGTKHPDVQYGTTENGYQPNNIGGTNLENTEIFVPYYGENVAVLKDKTGQLWLWNKYANEYQAVLQNSSVYKKVLESFCEKIRESIKNKDGMYDHRDLHNVLQKLENI